MFRSPWLQIFVLALVGLFAVVDRQILMLLIEPVKRDLQISDTQVSLLIGAAFVLFYSTVALPLSWLADRWSRRGVIMAGVLIWGLMTSACGFATGFWQLFAARMGVGLGEATFSPAAFALTAEATPRQRWGLALGALMLSSSTGYGLALLGGAAILEWSAHIALDLPWVGQVAGWKLVFVIFGALTLMTLPGLALIRPAPASPVPGSFSGAAWTRVRREWRAHAAIFLAIPPGSIAAYGLLAWLPSYLIRTHGLTPVDTGVALGALTLLFGSAGILTGAVIIDWLRRRRADAPLIVVALGIVVTGVAALLLASTDPSRELALALAGLIVFSIGVCTPAGPIAVQPITPDRHRAQVSAVYLLLNGIIGMAGGPAAVALLTDHVFRSEAAVGGSMAVVAATSSVLAVVLLLAFRKPYARLAGRMAIGGGNSEG